MKFRILCDFRIGNNKFKKNKVHEIDKKEAEELLKSGLIVEYKDENIVFEETAVLESLRAEKIADSKQIKDLQEEVKALKDDKKAAPSNELEKITEYLLQVENLEKMEVSLIDGIGKMLGLEVFGANKKEKAQSLFDQVTG